MRAGLPSPGDTRRDFFVDDRQNGDEQPNLALWQEQFCNLAADLPGNPTERVMS